jgi:hypothetical protein
MPGYPACRMRTGYRDAAAEARGAAERLAEERSYASD